MARRKSPAARHHPTMAAPITQATYVANVVAGATARGITGKALARIRVEAQEFWASRMNVSFSGAPSGSVNPN